MGKRDEMGKGKGQIGSEETEALGTEKTAPCLGYSGSCQDLLQGKGGASQPPQPPSLPRSRAAFALGPLQPSPILSSIYDRGRSISGT